MGSRCYRQVGRSISVHKISRCILSLLCTLPLLCFLQLLSRSVHREKCSNSSTVHWFHTACTSVSMFAINADNCLLLCSCFHQVSVFTFGLQPRHQIHHSLFNLILLWSAGSMVSGIPILQTCDVAVVLKRRLASFQHPRSSSL